MKAFPALCLPAGPRTGAALVLLSVEAKRGLPSLIIKWFLLFFVRVLVWFLVFKTERIAQAALNLLCS